MSSGIVAVFVRGSIGALTAIEYVIGLLGNFSDMISKIAHNKQSYGHEQMWHEDNIGNTFYKLKTYVSYFQAWHSEYHLIFHEIVIF